MRVSPRAKHRRRELPAPLPLHTYAPLRAQPALCLRVMLIIKIIDEMCHRVCVCDPDAVARCQKELPQTGSLCGERCSSELGVGAAAIDDCAVAVGREAGCIH